MRRLARELRSGAMSLYHYFDNRDELLELMGDTVAGEMLVADCPPSGAPALEAVARHSRATFLATRGCCPTLQDVPRRHARTCCATSSSPPRRSCRWPSRRRSGAAERHRRPRSTTTRSASPCARSPRAARGARAPLRRALRRPERPLPARERRVPVARRSFVARRRSRLERGRPGLRASGLEPGCLDGFAGAEHRLNRPMAIEFGEKVRRIPVYPAADGYAIGGPGRHARLQRVAVPADPGRRSRRSRRSLSGQQPLPGPDERRAAARSCPTSTASPRSRIAIGNGSCDILLAAGDALLEPGAELVYAWPSFSVYPHLAAASGARAIEVPLDDDHRHQLDKMREEITAATRLVIVCNPNNPTSTALPLDEIAEFVEVGPAPRRGDPRRGLRRVQRPAGPGRVGRSCSSATRTSCCCARSARSTASAGCGSATRCAAPRPSGPRSTRSASRSSATPPRRPRRSRRSTTRTRSPAASSATSPSGSASRTGCARSGSSPPSRRRTSSGSTSARRIESEVMKGLAERNILVRAGGALGRPGALRVTVGTQAENERFLEALATLL